MVTVDLPKAAAGRLLRLIITQNMDFHTRLWRVLKSKAEGKSKRFAIGVDDGSLEAIKHHNFLINYRCDSIPVYGHREKQRKGSSGETSDGNLPRPLRLERPNREVDLLPTEGENLDEPPF